jgi:hypothetical protein
LDGEVLTIEVARGIVAETPGHDGVFAVMSTIAAVGAEVRVIQRSCASEAPPCECGGLRRTGSSARLAGMTINRVEGITSMERRRRQSAAEEAHFVAVTDEPDRW